MRLVLETYTADYIISKMDVESTKFTQPQKQMPMWYAKLLVQKLRAVIESSTTTVHAEGKQL